MRHLLLLLPVLSLVACQAEPEVEGLSPSEVDELMLVNNLSSIAGLLGIELCNDHIDNDGDQLIDQADPDCSNPLGGFLGFLGETVEGSDIHGNPFERARMKTLTGTATISYDPGSFRRNIPAELVYIDDRTGEVTAVHLSSGVQADWVMSARKDGDRDAGLLIGLTNGGAYYAPGPLGDTLFVEGR
ncbi:MAG: hypothetical protein KC621_03500 [Myxococcales bacterium]|nr:hypothetical protein [Myxococcales bacterium]